MYQFGTIKLKLSALLVAKFKLLIIKEGKEQYTISAMVPMIVSRYDYRRKVLVTILSNGD